MPEWASALLRDALAPTGIVALALGWWFKSRRADRIRREATQQAIVEKLEAKIDALQAKVESLLMDAYAHEREANALRAERLALDKQLAALATAMTAALERADATNAKLMRDGR